MRLIHARTLVDDDVFEFKDFGEAPPRYAILSHTWEPTGEVTYQDALNPEKATTMDGYGKIWETCSLALAHQLDWAWVDTCCIDKTSSAELTESINSMFRWYEGAAVCFAFLKDLPPGPEDEEDGKRDTTGARGGRVARPRKTQLARCRWFTRGWTLQELIAPVSVLFYDGAWVFRGDKADLQASLADITGVDVSALRRERPLKDFPLAHRMAWAAARNTTRTEDLAYCLLGLFDVNMPLLYGEGCKAFRRLQEEIIKRSDDLTIFAWSPLPGARSRYCSALAPSPVAFRGSSAVEPFEDKMGADGGFALNNKGLRLNSALWMLRSEHSAGDEHDGVDDDDDDDNNDNNNNNNNNNNENDDSPEGDMVTFLELGTCPARGHHSAGVFLRKVGPGFFFRDGLLPLRTFAQHPPGAARVRTTDFYVAADIPPRPQAALDLPSLSRINFAVVPAPPRPAVVVSAWMPEEPWDHAHQLFFVSQRNFIQALRLKVPLPSSSSSATAAAGGSGSGGGETINVVVISDVNATLWQPRFRAFHESAHEGLARYLFRPKSFRARIKMEDLKWKFPEVARLKEGFDVRGGPRTGGLTVRAVKRLAIVPRVSATREIWCLDFEVVEGSKMLAAVGQAQGGRETVRVDLARGLERRRKATEDSLAP